MPFPTNPSVGDTYVENDTTYEYLGPVNGWFRKEVGPNNDTTYIGSDGAPGGVSNDTEVIFNDNGSLASDSGLTYNKTTDALSGGAFVPTGSTVPSNGIYLPSANNVAIVTNGTERMRISQNGDILKSKASGTVRNTIKSSSIANTEAAEFVVNGISGGTSRFAALSVYKHSGITQPVAYVYLHPEDGAGNFIWVDNSDILRISTTQSNVGTTGGTVVGTQTSDERIKNVLGPVEYGLETLKQVEPVRYSLKSQPDIEHLGFIAQQVQPLIPQSVFDTNEHIEGEPEDAPTKLGMEYIALIPVLVNAIKELSAEVDALKAQLQAQ